MNGRQVFRFATQVVATSIEETIEKAGLTIDEIALIVPHQANVRIIETAAKRLKIPVERFYLNVDSVGNTSAASIPMALCDAVQDGRLRPDDNVVFVGFGGGLNLGLFRGEAGTSPRQKCRCPAGNGGGPGILRPVPAPR